MMLKRELCLSVNAMSVIAYLGLKHFSFVFFLIVKTVFFILIPVFEKLQLGIYFLIGYWKRGSKSNSPYAAAASPTVERKYTAACLPKNHRIPTAAGDV